MEQGKQRKPRGTPLRRRLPEVDSEEAGSEVIEVRREEALADFITEAVGYTDEEVDQILIGLEDQGTAYDWVDSLNEYKLPKALQELQDSGEQAFRWVDSSDTVCMVQTTRDNFRWTPVNYMSHGKYFPKRERRMRFDRNGGIMSGYMLLCWMPGRLYRAWGSLKSKLARRERWTDTPSKLDGVHKYDPVAEGNAAANVDDGTGKPLYATNERFSGVVHEIPDSAPESEGEN